MVSVWFRVPNSIFHQLRLSQGGIPFQKKFLAPGSLCNVCLANRSMDQSSPARFLKRELPAYQQIAEALKLAITAGELPVGARLPTVRALAEQYGTSVSTIQTALDSLAEAGLIDRARRRGTFVTATSPKLSSVGVYFGRDFIHGNGMQFYRELHRRLGRELEARGVRNRSWIDGRPDAQQGEPLPELVEAVSDGRMQGLIIGVTCPEEMRWLARLDVPLAACATAPVSYRVGFDNDQMMNLVVHEFKRQGCRSIGAIFPVSACAYGPPGTKVAEPIENFFKSFVDRVADAGLETRNSWVRVPDRELSGGDHEGFGYEQFLEIWNQPARPDGLLIYPDTIVRGCVSAMLRCGVSVPGELKLVLHRNQGIPVHCPLPASWLVSDPGEIASALIAQIEKQVAGQPVPTHPPLPLTKNENKHHIPSIIVPFHGPSPVAVSPFRGRGKRCNHSFG
jgi:DNA-binding LacI/PurR family transcriptional regulator